MKGRRMRVVLVGAPDSGKNSVAQELIKQNLVQKSLGHPVEILDPYLEVAVGELADYRVEVLLAARRAFLQAEEDVVFTHTSVDNIAYAAQRASTLLHIDEGSPEAATAAAVLKLVADMFIDSFRGDVIIFLTGNDGTEYGQELENLLEYALDDFNIDHTVVEEDFPERLEKVVEIVRQYQGSESDLSESSTAQD
jgi:hypothetical protein